MVTANPTTQYGSIIQEVIPSPVVILPVAAEVPEPQVQTETPATAAHRGISAATAIVIVFRDAHHVPVARAEPVAVVVMAVQAQQLRV